jgi:hypothetical protein
MGSERLDVNQYIQSVTLNILYKNISQICEKTVNSDKHIFYDYFGLTLTVDKQFNIQ